MWNIHTTHHSRSNLCLSVDFSERSKDGSDVSLPTLSGHVLIPGSPSQMVVSSWLSYSTWLPLGLCQTSHKPCEGCVCGCIGWMSSALLQSVSWRSYMTWWLILGWWGYLGVLLQGLLLPLFCLGKNPVLTFAEVVFVNRNSRSFWSEVLQGRGRVLWSQAFGGGTVLPTACSSHLKQYWSNASNL